MNPKHTFYKWLIPVAVLFTVIVLDACKHETAAPITTGGSTSGSTTTSGTTTSGSTSGSTTCDPNTVYFQTQVLPILVSNCAKSGCHDAGTAADGNNFTTYQGVMDSGEVEPYDPGSSDLIEVLFEDDEDKMMPPTGHARPTQDQINLLIKWIEQGAQNLTCTVTTCDTANVTFTGTIKPIIQANCQGCHSGSAPSGGLNFTTHAGLQAVALNGRLSGAINHQSGFMAMPQGGNKLPDCELTKIRIWIEAGAPNN